MTTIKGHVLKTVPVLYSHQNRKPLPLGKNYLSDQITKGLIHSGSLEADIARSLRSIQKLRRKYRAKNRIPKSRNTLKLKPKSSKA